MVGYQQRRGGGGVDEGNEIQGGQEKTKSKFLKKGEGAGGWERRNLKLNYITAGARMFSLMWMYGWRLSPGEMIRPRALHLFLLRPRTSSHSDLARDSTISALDAGQDA